MAFFFQAAEEGGGEEKLALEEDENTKINMDHYYPEEYDQYAEGMKKSHYSHPRDLSIHTKRAG